MKNGNSRGLTKLELRIMQAVWRLGGGTVSAVQAEIEPPLAYTTVQTMLNILERKAKLRRQLEGRAYVYTAAVSEAKALGQGVRDLVDRMFGGSSEELVMSLLKNRQIDAARLAELTERFNQDSRDREAREKETRKKEAGQS
ncbi:MAG TPA: BlaI/MecI/CopY family transcriptional regulator [Terracidiphilus sp.]|jgi:predicted transcriptional regulator|nr:BlaI/MecI/CopY family transcriptional regulator [Terracidiphilus sp.]